MFEDKFDDKDKGKHKPSKKDDSLTIRTSAGYTSFTGTNNYDESLLSTNLKPELSIESKFKNFYLNFSTNQYDGTEGARRGKVGVFTQTTYLTGNGANQANDRYNQNYITNFKTEALTQTFGLDVIANSVAFKAGIGPSLYNTSGTITNYQEGAQKDFNSKKVGLGITAEFQFPISDVISSIANGHQQTSRFHVNFLTKYDGVVSLNKSQENPSVSTVVAGIKAVIDLTADKRTNLEFSVGKSLLDSNDKHSQQHPMKGGLAWGVSLSVPVTFGFDSGHGNHGKAGKRERLDYTVSPGSETTNLEPKYKDSVIKPTPEGSSLQLSSFETILAEGNFTKGEKARINVIIDSMSQAGIDYKGNGQGLDEKQSKIFNKAREAVLVLSDEGEQLYSSKANAEKSRNFTKVTHELQDAFKDSGMVFKENLKDVDLSKLNSPAASDGKIPTKTNVFEK